MTMRTYLLRWLRPQKPQFQYNGMKTVKQSHTKWLCRSEVQATALHIAIKIVLGG
jgi:hypothetical protein